MANLITCATAWFSKWTWTTNLKWFSIFFKKKKSIHLTHKNNLITNLFIVFYSNEHAIFATWVFRTCGCWCKLWCWHIQWTKPQRWPTCPAGRDPTLRRQAEHKSHRTPTPLPFAWSLRETFPREGKKMLNYKQVRQSIILCASDLTMFRTVKENPPRQTGTSHLGMVKVQKCT